MTIPLDSRNSLIMSRHIPFRCEPDKAYRNRAVVGIGGNLGNVLQRFHTLVRLLKIHPVIRLTAVSPILKNPAFGKTEQPDFYNSVMVVMTNLSYYQTLKTLLYLERRFGRRRKRVSQNAPRTLDLDLLFFNDLTVKRPNLIIPHPRWQERESVLLPLALLQERVS